MIFPSISSYHTITQLNYLPLLFPLTCSSYWPKVSMKFTRGLRYNNDTVTTATTTCFVVVVIKWIRAQWILSRLLACLGLIIRSKLKTQTSSKIKSEKSRTELRRPR